MSQVHRVHFKERNITDNFDSQKSLKLGPQQGFKKNRSIIFTWPCCLKLKTVYSDPHERKFVNERFAGSRTGNYVTLTGNEFYSLDEACIPRSVINEWVLWTRKGLGDRNRSAMN